MDEGPKNQENKEKVPFVIQIPEEAPENAGPVEPQEEEKTDGSGTEALKENEQAAAKTGAAPETTGKEDDEREEKLEQRRGCAKALIYAAIILTVSVLIAVFAVTSINDMLGLYKPDKQIDVQIPKGATAAEVTKILSSQKVIQNSITFRLYLKFVSHPGFQYGDFMLNSDMDYATIISTLTDNKQNRAVVKVTIPEGYTLRQIASTLEDKKICTADSFLNACEDDTFQFKYMTKDMQSEKRFYKLEGYLFPDTYEFYVKTPPHTVAQKMLDNFAAKFTDSMVTQAKQRNMTVDQVVTLASIIQAEASKQSEMPTVSSVFHNRLEKGTGSLNMLQSDATIFYITRTIERALKQSDLAVNSPYNTYRNKGLTPGPIGNPGTAALNAAISPSQTDYYYFVTDSDGNYYYAATLDQHNKNVTKASKVGTPKGTNVVVG